MRSRSTLFALVVVSVLIVGASWLYQYWTQSNNVQKDLESRQDYRIALSDVSISASTEPIACFAGVTILAWLLAVVKVFRSSSITRNLFGAVVVILVVFATYANIMDNELKQRNASYVLSPAAITSSLIWAVLGTAFAVVVWFVIERIYVALRIARDA
jgi:hypothetical protein